MVSHMDAVAASQVQFQPHVNIQSLMETVKCNKNYWTLTSYPVQTKDILKLLREMLAD